MSRFSLASFRPRRRGLRGFTLIELLVVISIIAMLISILLPALKSARDSAKSVQCLSNHRQLGLVMAVYTNDYERYPTYYDGGWWPTRMWNAQYITTPELVVDPGFESTFPNYSIIPSASIGAYMAWSHYGYNFRHIGSALASGGASTDSAATGDVLKASETILLVDNIYYTGYVSGTYTRGHNVTYDFPYTYTRPDGRHRNGVNTLWADGHASSVKVPERFEVHGPDALTNGNDPDNKWDRK